MRVKTFEEETYGLALTKTQRRVALTLLHEGPVSTQELGRLIGGAAVDNFMVTRSWVSKLRRKLDGSGWTVPMNAAGGPSVTGAYWIERTVTK